MKKNNSYKIRKPNIWKNKKTIQRSYKYEKFQIHSDWLIYTYNMVIPLIPIVTTKTESKFVDEIPSHSHKQ